MIAYPDLVNTLAGWRQEQGLPALTQDFGGGAPVANPVIDDGYQAEEATAFEQSPAFSADEVTPTEVPLDDGAIVEEAFEQIDTGAIEVEDLMVADEATVMTDSPAQFASSPEPAPLPEVGSVDEDATRIDVSAADLAGLAQPDLAQQDAAGGDDQNYPAIGQESPDQAATVIASGLQSNQDQDVEVELDDVLTEQPADTDQ